MRMKRPDLEKAIYIVCWDWELDPGTYTLHPAVLDEDAEDDDLGTTDGAHSFPFVSRCIQEPSLRWYSSAPIIFSTEEWRARLISPPLLFV
jgi:hypothetical protein